MARDSYDDMVSPDPRMRRGSGSSKVGLIAAFCVLICLVAVVLYLLFAPPQEEKVEAVTTSHEPISVEVKEPVKIVEQETKEVAEVKTEAPVQSVKEESTVAPVVARELSSAIKNDISPSNKLTFKEHIVQDGESLVSIAELYSLKPETLISVNRIKNIAAITASTLSAKIAGLSFPPLANSDFPKYRNFPKLCFFAILYRLFSHTTVALTFVISPSFSF